MLGSTGAGREGIKPSLLGSTLLTASLPHDCLHPLRDFLALLPRGLRMCVCVCVCVRVRMRARARACVLALVRVRFGALILDAGQIRASWV